MPTLDGLTDEQLSELKDRISQEQLDRLDRAKEAAGIPVFLPWES